MEGAAQKGTTVREAHERVDDAERLAKQTNAKFHEAVERAANARVALGKALRQRDQQAGDTRVDAAEYELDQAHVELDRAYAEFDRTAARAQAAMRELIRARRRLWALLDAKRDGK